MAHNSITGDAGAGKTAAEADGGGKGVLVATSLRYQQARVKRTDAGVKSATTSAKAND